MESYWRGKLGLDPLLKDYIEEMLASMNQFHLPKPDEMFGLLTKKYGDNTTELFPSDAVTVGNGQSMMAGKIGNIAGTVYNKHGSPMYNATLTDVSHVAGGQFNLFSVTRKMKEGWLLRGDQESMWLEKGPDCVPIVRQQIREYWSKTRSKLLDVHHEGIVKYLEDIGAISNIHKSRK